MMKSHFCCITNKYKYRDADKNTNSEWWMRMKKALRDAGGSFHSSTFVPWFDSYGTSQI